MRYLACPAITALALSIAPAFAQGTEILGTWCNQNETLTSWDAVVTLSRGANGGLQIEYRFQDSSAAFDLEEGAPDVYLQQGSASGDGFEVTDDGLLIIFDNIGPISEAFPYGPGMTCYR